VDADGSKTVGWIARGVGCALFVGLLALLTYILVYMSVAYDQAPLWGELAPDEFVLPVTMAVGSVLGVLFAIVVPRLVFRRMGLRANDPRSREIHVTARFLVTAALSAGALVPGYVGAFMVQDLTFWAATVLLGVLPLLLSWPTRRRRERWSPSGSSAAAADGA